jgi:lysophospholipase L1-like esterase
MEGILQSFWTSQQIHDESILLIQDELGIIKGNLLFVPQEIVEVVTYDIQTEQKQVWQQGIDYKVEGKTLIALNKKIPFMTWQEVSGEKQIEGFNYTQIPSTTEGIFLPHTEDASLVSRQIYVTYRHQEKWKGTYPTYQGNVLKVSIDKLKNHERLNLFVYGDSISTGANSTGFLHVYPFKESWPNLVANNLSLAYQADVRLLNKSVGGWTSEDAIKNEPTEGWIEGQLGTQVGIGKILEQMPEYMPDLVILGFGMNDATVGIDKKTYGLYLEKIIETIRKRNRKCEFILIGTMLANEKARNHAKNQIGYYAVLEEIANKNQAIVAVNIGKIHQEMLDHGKNYIDMSGNNVNHPNDFLASIYAMTILGLLIP